MNDGKSCLAHNHSCWTDVNTVIHNILYHWIVNGHSHTYTSQIKGILSGSMQWCIVLVPSSHKTNY